MSNKFFVIKGHTYHGEERKELMSTGPSRISRDEKYNM
jgi:hypothetical protein